MKLKNLFKSFKKRSHLFILLFLSSTTHAQSFLKLWYNKPATQWTEALPIGNGRIGVMIFGGVEEELLQLNESTLYSGGPVKKHINPDAHEYLPQIREALLVHQDYGKADSLARKMQGLYTESYMPLGDIIIKQNFKGEKPSMYYRDLDLQNAITTTSFVIKGVEYKRQVFTSAPSNVLAIKITANKKEALTLDISSRSLLRYALSVTPHELVVSGKAPAHVDPNYYNPPGREPVIYEDSTGCNGMRFQYRIRAITKDGTVSIDTGGIHVVNASEVTLYMTAATSFNGFDKCPDKDEKAIATSFMAKAIKLSYDQLLVAHKKDFQHFFNRVSFTVKDSTGITGNSTLPSDERLKSYSAGAYDPSLETLYFQYGRYLLISSSRPGSPPANLQGIWNMELRPPWSSNYTININTQMNYWPAEVTRSMAISPARRVWQNCFCRVMQEPCTFCRRCLPFGGKDR
jgi:alpha-L-fucosidase 2